MATQHATVVSSYCNLGGDKLIVAGTVLFVLPVYDGPDGLKRARLDSSFRREAETAMPRLELRQHGRAIKGVIVNEEGLDVFWKINESNFKLLHLAAAPPPPPPPPSRLCSSKGKCQGCAVRSAKVRTGTPPPPVKTRGLVFSSHKPPVPPRGMENRRSRAEEPSEEGVNKNGGQMKLKPLHWDKVIANADHSMVWNEINDGSFSKKASYHQQRSSASVPSAQTFLLDPRKSQNVAIVLKSLAISRKEILDALLDGRGLSADTLEKLTKNPPQEEITRILQFIGKPTKLADAESFLYHILKAVPSAFIRFNAMLFRTTYDPEILHHKQCLQTLELGCKELRSGGVFFKLLEAILKAGNRMNAGTTRGNAQGFNLTALRRLSDVKSTNGKTTLLHFVVEQVVRSEGRRRSINTNRKPGDHPVSGTKNSNEEQDREHLMLDCQRWKT
ncbi:UNVERIFIED_CONTAM: Formin-like protein 8 [Sesamum radiatum]|uniref:Formin-like protein n=1 Tax=Sesamum radiatum TaxID=300843 RepID=A0AAW2WK04_SESRA